MILDRTVSVQTLQATSADADIETYQTLAGAENIKMNIQPASPELTVLSEGQVGKTFRFFTTYSGLGIGMRITVSGSGDVFDVRGIDDWDFGPLPHYEGVIFKMEE